jgi:prepilin signal peptidase PulO-like enzyme (type II secretory pathway)
MTHLITGIIALYGLLIGSAINAIVWRLYTEKSWTRGRSMCPDCMHVLAAKDLIPVISWVFLRGRCRYCREKIHWQYPAVELATAFLYGLSYVALAPVGVLAWVFFLIWIVFMTMMLIMAVCDLRWLILPNKIMFPLLILGLARLILVAVTLHGAQQWLGPLEAMALAGGGFWILASLKNGSMMGGGDVKLAAFMGLLLGLSKTALAMLLAFNAAAIISIALIGLKLRNRNDLIPFGPFLIGATIIAYLYGGQIVHWYLQLNGLQA